MDYNFDSKKEFIRYKNVGNKNYDANYTEWSNAVRIKYEHITVDSLINFSRFLINKRHKYASNDSDTKGFLMPAIVLLITLGLTTVSTLYSRIIADIDTLKEQIDYYDNFFITIILVVVAVAYISVFVIYTLINKSSKKASFYNDYIEIIKTMIKQRINTALK